jgi:hypothetical protein
MKLLGLEYDIGLLTSMTSPPEVIICVTGDGKTILIPKTAIILLFAIVCIGVYFFMGLV